MLTLLSWLVFGALVGGVARLLLPGRQPMGFVATVALGIVGSLAGGMVANLLTQRHLLEMHAVGFIGSVIGALVLLFAFVATSRRRASVT